MLIRYRQHEGCVVREGEVPIELKMTDAVILIKVAIVMVPVLVLPLGHVSLLLVFRCADLCHPELQHTDVEVTELVCERVDTQRNQGNVTQRGVSESPCQRATYVDRVLSLGLLLREAVAACTVVLTDEVLCVDIAIVLQLTDYNRERFDLLLLPP